MEEIELDPERIEVELHDFQLSLSDEIVKEYLVFYSHPQLGRMGGGGPTIEDCIGRVKRDIKRKKRKKS